MKTLLWIALVSLVLNVSLAVPFSDDELEALNDELKETEENPGRYRPYKIRLISIHVKVTENLKMAAASESYLV